MPADFTVKASDVSALLKELRAIEPDLVKELRAELRSGLKPIANKLKGRVPPESPLSGFAKGTAKQARYTWAPMLATVKTPLGKRARSAGVYPVVSLSLRGSRKTAGVWILEMARSGRSPRGSAMVANLNSKAPIQGGLGRFILPEGKKEAPEATRIARGVLEKFMAKVGRRLK